MMTLTLDQLERQHKMKLEELLVVAGSSNHLARMLNITPMRVKGWEQRGRVSKDGALLVEMHKFLGTKFKARDLRPEIYH